MYSTLVRWLKYSPQELKAFLQKKVLPQKQNMLNAELAVLSAG